MQRRGAWLCAGPGSAIGRDDRPRITAEASDAQGRASCWPNGNGRQESHQRLQRHSHRQPGPRRFRIDQPGSGRAQRQRVRLRPGGLPFPGWVASDVNRGLPCCDGKAFGSPFWRGG